MMRAHVLKIAMIGVPVIVWLSTAGAAGNDWSRDEFPFKFTMPPATVFLYIPAGTTKTRALLLLQQNVVEQKISVHPAIRQVCDSNDIAIAWCNPGFDAQFQTDPDSSHRMIQNRFNAFGATIGYPELGSVPLITFGHSATNGYAQRSAEARPDRVLAVLATHGWNGIGSFSNYKGPMLLFYGCKWEMNQNTDQNITLNRGISVLGDVYAKIAQNWMPVSVVEQYGSGHFDYSDEMVGLFAMFIGKAVQARLDSNGAMHDVDPAQGWIAPGIAGSPVGPIAIKPYAQGTALEKARSIWFFDQEMAEAAAAVIYGNGPWNRTFQMVWYNTAGGTPLAASGNGVVSQLPYRVVPGTNEIHFWPALPGAIPSGFVQAGTAINHSGDSTITMEYDCGPYIYTDARGTRRVKINRGRTNGYVVARHRGDSVYRPCVQPASWSLSLTTGSSTLASPGDQIAGAVIMLPDKSTAGEYYGFYVDHGPARINNERQLQILPLPANTAGPVEVQLCAYTLAQSAASAGSVTFNVRRPGVAVSRMSAADPGRHPAISTSDEHLTVRLPRSGAGNVHLYNLQGRLIAQRSLESTWPSGTRVVPVSLITSGAYLRPPRLVSWRSGLLTLRSLLH